MPRKETYDERVAQVNIATASRDAAIAAVNQAQLNLDYTRVTAPVSGRMGRHEVSIGNLIMGGISGSHHAAHHHRLARSDLAQLQCQRGRRHDL